MADQTKVVDDLRQIEFKNLIAGPLVAAIEAQALSASTTIDFINEVGLDEPVNGIQNIRQVGFSYAKSDADGVTRTFDLVVPFLTIVPVPYIRIDSIDISFKATLTDTIRTETTGAEGSFTSLDWGSRWRSDISFRTSQVKNNTTVDSANANREYVYEVKVHATQDEMPGGLGKILGILEKAIGDGTVRPKLEGITDSSSAGTSTIRLTHAATGVTIRYSVDGSVPGADSLTFPSAGLPLVAGQTVHIKAVAFDGAGVKNPSPLFEKWYTFGKFTE